MRCVVGCQGTPLTSNFLKEPQGGGDTLWLFYSKQEPHIPQCKVHRSSMALRKVACLKIWVDQFVYVSNWKVVVYSTRRIWNLKIFLKKILIQCQPDNKDFTSLYVHGNSKAWISPNHFFQIILAFEPYEIPTLFTARTPNQTLLDLQSALHNCSSTGNWQKLLK